MVPRVGQKIGPYEILGRLGSGGMGLVFSAWDSRLQRDVAIKLLREEFATPGMRQRFLQEARAASRLNHANICTIFDIGEQEGDPYLVMELLKGETIRTRITRAGVSPEDVLAVGIETADALIVAHGRGIIHRDIKPANIILVDKANGFLTKVLDFGLAKVEDSLDATRHDLTSAGTTVGTVAYMSPEQAKGEPLDARSDLFSLGVVLYEMATGELPFQGATSALVFVQLLGHKPEPIRDFNPDIPKDLDRAIMKLLEKKRTDRYQSASDTVDALRKIVLKKGSEKKSMWGTKPSTGWGKGEPVAAPPKRERESSRPQSGSAETSKWGILGDKNGQTTITPGYRSRTAEPAARSAEARSGESSEAFIRPVRRVVDHGMTPKPESNAAYVPPVIPPPPAAAAAVVPAAPAAPVAPVRGESSGVHRAGPGSSPPAGSSAVHRAAARENGPLGSSGAHSPARTLRPEIPPQAVRLVPRAPLGRFKQPDLGGEETQKISRVRQVAVGPTYVAEDAEESRAPRRKAGKGLWIGLAALVIVAAGGAFGWYETHPAAPVADVPTSILLATLENRTGDTPLGGVFKAGLRFELEQSPHLTVYGAGELAQGLKLIGSADTDEPDLEMARRAAQAIGASTVAIGELRTQNDAHGGPSSYVLLVQVYDVAKGTRLGEVSEIAPSREQIGDAVGQVASDLRSTLGETGDSIGRTSVPLSREATGNLDALQAYESADKLKGQGQIDDAMAAFLRAAQADPKFTQAYIELADIYRRQDAEVAASEAAAQAQANLAEAGSRTQARAQASYDLNTAGDYLHAISTLEQLCTNYPGDVEARVQLALAYRLAGKFAESLATAQAVLKMEPFNIQASGDAELAQLAMEHADAAAQMEQQSQRAGQPHPGVHLLIGMLTSSPVAAPDQGTAPERLSAQISLASVLDASGQFTAGLTSWNSVATNARASVTGKLGSTASYALAHAALDRAMGTDCANALGLAKQATASAAGPNATYSAGLAEALCGDVADAQKAVTTLTAGSGQSFAATGFYVPNLTAAIQWKSGDVAGALGTLQGAKGDDMLSLTPYLRGVIHVAAKQTQLALADFQAVIQHRGALSLVTPEAYPMAVLGTARAHAAGGDTAGAAAGYRKFLNLWTSPDTSSAVYHEAQAGVK